MFPASSPKIKVSGYLANIASKLSLSTNRASTSSEESLYMGKTSFAAVQPDNGQASFPSFRCQFPRADARNHVAHRAGCRQLPGILSFRL